MRILKELTAELIGMFVAEKRLTLAVLALVAATGFLLDFTSLNQLIVGAVLPFGCVLLLIENVCRAARARASEGGTRNDRRTRCNRTTRY